MVYYLFVLIRSIFSFTPPFKIVVFPQLLTDTTIIKSFDYNKRIAAVLAQLPLLIVCSG